jgi:hypothetical protein
LPPLSARPCLGVRGWTAERSGIIFSLSLSIYISFFSKEKQVYFLLIVTKRRVEGHRELSLVSVSAVRTAPTGHSWSRDSASRPAVRGGGTMGDSGGAARTNPPC